LPATRVDITLEEVPEGTRLRVREQAAFSLGTEPARASGTLAPVGS